MASAHPIDPIALLTGLHATREFLPDPVPDDAIRDILEVVRWSGSSMNRQPWHVVLVRDRALLARLGEIGAYTKHVAAAPLAAVLVMDGDDAITEAYDEGRLSERIMLAAAAHGLGSCIGWYWQEGDGPAVKALLGIPEHRTVLTAISIGYPKDGASLIRQRAGATRKPMEEIVSWDRFGG